MGGNPDLVRLEATERADIGDVLALQLLQHGYARLALGALLGWRPVNSPGPGLPGTPLVGCGFLKTPTISVVGTTISFPERAILIYAEPTFSGTAVADVDGLVVAYNPAAAGQDTSVSVAGLSPDQPWIWARVVWVDGAADTRRHWSGGAETGYSPNTRSLARVEWDVGVTIPASGVGWFPVARVVSWLAGVPLVKPVLIWDDWPTDAVVGDELDTIMSAELAGIGLVPQLAALRSQVATILDATLGTPWTTPPTVGLKTLAQAAIAWADGTIKYSGPPVAAYVATAHNATAATSGAGHWTFELAYPGWDYTVSSVQVTQMDDRPYADGLAPTVTFPPTVGTSGAPITVDLDVLDTTNSAFDHALTFTIFIRRA